MAIKNQHHGTARGTPRTLQAAIATTRFVAGLPLDGVHRTDARWGKPGTQALTQTGRASRWAHYPHRRRASIRMIALSAVALGGVGMVSSPLSTVQTLRVVSWMVLATSAWAIWEKSRRYVHRRELIAPLAETLASHLKDSRYVLDPATWISVPVDVQDRPSRIYLSRTYNPNEAQERALVRLVARKIGLVNPSHTLQLQGEWPFLELRPAPAPRDLVAFSAPEIRALVDSAVDGQPLLGLAPRDAPYYLDLDAESPHVGFSMATGAGKSVAGRAVIAQNLHHGGITLVCDRKIVSQAWCAGLPGVRYARTEKEIHDALLWVSAEVDRRYQVIREHADIKGEVDPALIGPRLEVVIEELNTLEMDIRSWWREYREEHGGPASPPALGALGRIVAMGRQGRVHMFVISQKLTCQSIGGTAARENLSTRVLGRATTSTWNMLAPECKVGGKYPRSSGKVRGRVHVVFGPEATPVQIIKMDEEEARDYAMSGVVTTFPTGEAGADPQRSDHRETSGVRQPHPGETLIGEAGSEAGASHLRLMPDLEPGPGLDMESVDELITLADSADRLEVNIKTLRNARERDARFPDSVESGKGKASLYYWVDLELWDQSRGEGSGGDAA